MERDDLEAGGTIEASNLSDTAIRSIVAHLAHLRARYGEVLADPDLVEPTGEYFPDVFALEPAAITRLLRRMMTYAPLSTDLDVEVVFVEAEDSGGGGCGSGACAPGDRARPTAPAIRPAIETADGYAAIVAASDVADPKHLTSSLARSVGRLVLFEAGEEIDPRRDDEAALAEITAVASGFGVILLNGACVYKKGCGGMRRHQATVLGLEELALATAFFVRANDRKPGTVRRHLEVTQREAFDAALAWVDEQPRLVRALAEAPASLADGVFTLEGKKGFFSRLFAGPAHKRGREDDVPEAIPASAKARSRTPEELRRIAEAKALVEEALSPVGDHEAHLPHRGSRSA